MKFRKRVTENTGSIKAKQKLFSSIAVKAAQDALDNNRLYAIYLEIKLLNNQQME